MGYHNGKNELCIMHRKIQLWFFFIIFRRPCIFCSILIAHRALLLYLGFNRCPFQLLRSYKRHEENKRKIGQERSSMQQANVIGPLHECKKVCQWMQESVSMHKSPTPVRHSRMNQARSEEEEKERQERQRPGGWWQERQPNKTKHIGGTKTRPIHRYSSG